MTANDTIILARKHLNDISVNLSRKCLAEAVKAYNDGLYEVAKQFAIDSLSHSVGVTHKDYKRASKKGG